MLKSSFPDTWADLCPRQAAFIPTSAKSCLFCFHHVEWHPAPVSPTGFQSGLEVELPEVLLFFVKCPEILTYLILSFRPGMIFLAGNMAVLYVHSYLQLKKGIITHKIFWRKHIPGFPLAFISTCLFSVSPTALTRRQVVADIQSLRTVYEKKSLNIEKILPIKLMCSGNWNFYYSIFMVKTLHWACGMPVFQVMENVPTSHSFLKA